MIVVANRIPVHAEYAGAFEEVFANRASLVDQMPGFVAYHLLRPQSDGAPYVVMTFWESYDHFKAWVESPEFKEGHGRSGTLPREAFAGQSVLEIHEVI